MEARRLSFSLLLDYLLQAAESCIKVRRACDWVVTLSNSCRNFNGSMSPSVLHTNFDGASFGFPSPLRTVSFHDAS